MVEIYTWTYLETQNPGAEEEGLKIWGQPELYENKCYFLCLIYFPNSTTI